jgi:hypothetical protein
MINNSFIKINNTEVSEINLDLGIYSYIAMFSCINVI